LELLELKANIRTGVGNSPGRALRREGRIPAVLYGPETEPILLSVGISDLELAIKKSKIGQVLLNLDIQNGDTKTAMIKDLQTHPVTGNFLHADFYEIAMDRKIRVKVPVVTKGESEGVQLGGMLQIIRRELEVLCLPFEVPEKIEVDITGLDIGDSIHVDEIPLEGNIDIPADVNFTVLTILGKKAEVIAAEEAEEEELAEEVSEAGGEE
jgi:large subunit ribosomal protein L25